jgi:hypothetical protein
MLSENFIYFFTVWGFFIGIVFGILKSLDATGLLTYTLLITTFFYLFGHLVIAMYYKTMNVKTYLFPKELHEKELDFFVDEIKKREQIIERAIHMTDSLTELNMNDNKGARS